MIKNPSDAYRETAKRHSEISIEYAIGVLEDINGKKTAAETLIALSDKITELKSLIK